MTEEPIIKPVYVWHDYVVAVAFFPVAFLAACIMAFFVLLPNAVKTRVENRALDRTLQRMRAEGAFDTIRRTDA